MPSNIHIMVSAEMKISEDTAEKCRNNGKS
jgi:hypothetical protein